MRAEDREVEGIEDALALVAPDARPAAGVVPDLGESRYSAHHFGVRQPTGSQEHGSGPGYDDGPRYGLRPNLIAGHGAGGEHEDGKDHGCQDQDGQDHGGHGGEDHEAQERDDQRKEHAGGPTPGAPTPGDTARHGRPEKHEHGAGQGHGASRKDGALPPGRGEARPHGLTWAAARDRAAAAGRSALVPAVLRRPLGQALGLVLAEPLSALTDLPPFDTSAMDGWAVSGPGPWKVRGAGGRKDDGPSASGAPAEGTDGILAGHAEAAPLADGDAVRIATGARVPPDTTAVIRTEHSRLDSVGRLYAERPVSPGQDIRPRGQECRTGDRLLPTGSLVTPAVLGLAAAAGYDTLPTLPRPRVEVFILGDELLTEGLPHDGLIRDALGPMISPWLRALGVDIVGTRRVGDDIDALHRAVSESQAECVITTGGTAAGPVDHVHPVLRTLGAELLVDGVAVRPGHPMLLARLPSGRHLVGLPGNPLAAVSGLLTLAEPLLRELAGRQSRPRCTVGVRDEVPGHPSDTRLVPVVRVGDQLVPLHFHGPAMLRGIAAADALAVVPPGGAPPGEELEVLDLPWTMPADGGCFT